MDNLTHSLVGLVAAKAGLERLSPYATAVCIASANAADADSFVVLFGDRWTLLEHHRGITHSIIGTLVIGCLVPVIIFAIERATGRWRKHRPRIRFRALLLASMIVAVTHPVMDWTNNYGVRPLLPWNGRWFYGDFVFIIDPYIWLGLGGVGFLLTSRRRFQLIGWTLVCAGASTVILVAGTRRGFDSGGLAVARVVWIVAILFLIALRAKVGPRGISRQVAVAALAVLVVYWGALAVAHHFAYQQAAAAARNFAAVRGESVVKLATMPTVATPLRWQSVAETDRAMYRFFVGLSDSANPSHFVIPDRFEKPTGKVAELVTIAQRDHGAQTLLGFARFPIAQLAAADCVGQTLVQFADLRYTEPGTTRGNFSVDVSVDCPEH